MVLMLCCSATFAASINITSVTPNTGPVIGGTSITIAGTGFDPAATVTIGGNAATNVVVNSATQITCTTPPQTLATSSANIIVFNPNDVAELAAGFTYAAVSPGLNYKYYQQIGTPGPLPNPDFSTLTPFNTGNVPNATIIDVPGTNPFETGRNNTWSVQYFGYVNLPASGIWTLFTASDDGSRLYLDGNPVPFVDNNVFQGVTEKGSAPTVLSGNAFSPN